MLQILSFNEVNNCGMEKTIQTSTHLLHLQEDSLNRMHIYMCIKKFMCNCYSLVETKTHIGYLLLFPSQESIYYCFLLIMNKLI